MISWPRTKLGDLVSIKHGYAFKGEYFRDAPPGDVLLTPGNFAIGGGFQLGKLKYYDGPAVKAYELSPGDLLVTMTDLSKAGDTLGYPAIVPDDGRVYLHNQRLGKVEVRDARTSHDFVYWLMRTRSYREEVLSGVTGSTVKHTSPRKIEAYEFELPPRPEQDAICGVLNPLDEKIELNRRMNETLEAMAQAIFRDWFVDFGPVRRKLAGETDPVAIMGGLTPDPARAAELAALFPAALADEGLPIGWSLGRADELVEFNPKEPLPKGTIAPYSDMASLPTAGPTADKPSLRPFGSGMRFRNGDALLARITPCLENGKAAFVDFLTDQMPVGWGSTEFIVHRARPGTPRALPYLLCRNPEYRAHAIQSMTGTSGRQRAQVETLEAWPLAVPPPLILGAFGQLSDTFFDRMSSNARENQTLAETRDYLLPRLMSGAVRVGGIEAAA